MKKICSLILLFFLQNFAIQAQFNATFGFINVGNNTGVLDPGPYPQVSGLIFSGFQAIGVSAQPSASGRFAFSGWGTGAVNAVDDINQFAGAFSALQYYELKLTPQMGYRVQLNRVYFHMRRSTTGARSFSVRSNQTNFASNLPANSGTASAVTVYPGDEFFWLYDSAGTSSDQKILSVKPLQTICNAGDSVVLRFYAWNAESSSGSFSIDNVTISGTVTSAEADVEQVTYDDNAIEYNAKNHTLQLRNSSNACWRIVAANGSVLLLQNATCVDLSGFSDSLYFITAEVKGVIYSKKILSP